MSAQRVLVTGASRGIGAAVATLLAARGDVVWMTAREQDGLAGRATALGVPATRALAVDLASEGAAKRIVDALGDAQLDAFVGVAGIQQTAPLGAIDADDLRALLEVNLVAPILLTQALAPRLVDGASVVHVSSNLAHRPVPGRIAYAASKGGLEAAVRALAVELAPRRIRVNTVALGLVETDMTRALPLAAIAQRYPLGIGRAEDAAAAIVALLDMPWTTGATLVVDGGGLVHSDS